MNSPASEPQGPIRTPLPNPLPVRRGEGEATPHSLSALIQRQCSPALSSKGGEGVPSNLSWWW
jgi:hypothetical protein